MTAWPPNTDHKSMTVTFAPARPASNAAARPEIPAPTMIRSAFGGGSAESRVSAPCERGPAPPRTRHKSSTAVFIILGAPTLVDSVDCAVHDKKPKCSRSLLPLDVQTGMLKDVDLRCACLRGCPSYRLLATTKWFRAAASLRVSAPTIPAATLFSQHGFRRATCRDGIGVAVDELPAGADFLVNARHARREFREVRARAQLCAIMFDLDKNDDLLVAIDRDAIDRDNRTILIFGRRVVQHL